MKSRIKINSEGKNVDKKKNTKFLKAELQDKIAMILRQQIAI